MIASTSYIVFQGTRHVATGSHEQISTTLKVTDPGQPILVFDSQTGAQIDLGLIPNTTSDAPLTRGRGRPKLGVVAREVTLLPRHWDWLSGQQGGASVALRRIVDEASKSPKERERVASENAYKFMQAIAGDLPGYEEALRALFARNREGFETQIASWPEDVRAQATRFGFPEKLL